MTRLTIPAPVVGEKVTAAEPKVGTDITTIETWANGEIDSTNIKAEGITEADLDTATKSLLNTKSAAALTLTEKNSAAVTAASGELVVMLKDASVLTLPEPTLNRIVGVFASKVVTSIKVKCTKVATTIAGDFFEATEVTLTGGQHLLVQGTGGGWIVLAGEPKREQVYSAQNPITSDVEIEPSATRPSSVTVSCNSPSGVEGRFIVQAAGKTVSTLQFPGGSASEATIPCSLRLMPAQKFKVHIEGAGATASYHVLVE